MTTAVRLASIAATPIKIQWQRRSIVSPKHEHGHAHGRHGAKQPEAFDPRRAALLDDPKRFEYLPPSRIISMLEAPDSGVVVDFGAGTGAYAIPLAEHRPDLTVIALDEQREMLQMLAAKPAAKRLQNLVPTHTDENDTIKGKADRILVLNVLHEVGDEPLRGMVELLEPAGSILFIDWNAAVDRPMGPPRDHTYTPADAKRRLEGFGLSVEELEPLPYHFVLRARRK
jgi:SAM-dependent methyltransferase